MHIPEFVHAKKNNIEPDHLTVERVAEEKQKLKTAFAYIFLQSYKRHF